MSAKMHIVILRCVYVKLILNIVTAVYMYNTQTQL